MVAVKNAIRELAKYALAKKGARHDPSWSHVDPHMVPHIELQDATWGEFFEVREHDGEPFAHMPVLEEDWKLLVKLHPQLVKRGSVARDGHAYMYVPLGGQIPFATIREWIDIAHALVWKKLDKRDVFKIELAGLPYDEPKLLDRLIEFQGLAKHRKAIHKLVKPAILLRTKKASEAKIPLGATKIGGKPDLPAKVKWPTYANGTPLGFLAQIDLAEIAKIGNPVKGLPSSGLLSVFSIWAWMENEDFKLPLPELRDIARQEELGWTVALHTLPVQNWNAKRLPME